MPIQKNSIRQPILKYIIAAMPRSGSNLLCRQLTRVDLGFPFEWFYPYPRVSDLVESLGFETYDSVEYAKYILANKISESGTFGVKLHWEQFCDLSACVRYRVASGSRYIFTRRRDLAKQVLSHEIGLATGRWDPRWEPNPDTINPDADPENLQRLEALARNLVAVEREWFEFFDSHDIEPHVVFYEDFLADPGVCQLAIYSFLGVKRQTPPVEPPPQGKTGTSTRDRQILEAMEPLIAPLQDQRPGIS